MGTDEDILEFVFVDCMSTICGLKWKWRRGVRDPYGWPDSDKT